MVAPVLSDKFVNTGSDGKVTSKAESLASAKATKYASVAYDDLKVTAFGDAAVATGDFKAKGTDPEGKPLDVHERFTDTWVKGPKGQWQCVASHQSTVK
jgi:ketosteroid isomerase-like protein